MFGQTVMYILYKGVAIVASILFMEKAGVTMEYLLIMALVFSCTLSVEYLLSRILYKQHVRFETAWNTLFLIVIFLYKPVQLLPIVIILVIQIADYYSRGLYFYYIVIGALLLAICIINPPSDILVVSILIDILLCYTRIIRERLDISKALILEQKEELADLNQKLTDNRRLAKTLQYTAGLEERNRLAARLHDKVGHGVSGSIILLEAARLMFDQDAEKAKVGIDKAISNLRAGVDDIRAALREERPIKSELGLNELQNTLDKFQLDHNVQTKLIINGNTDYISIAVWQCMNENLEEALTNLLKHSNATEFKLSLQIFNKIIKAEYVDNGKNNSKFTKGLGLEAIEERTIKCGGRCFFEVSENEFRIINIFTY